MINRFIDWLGHKTKIDAHYITQNGFWVLFSQLSGSILAFATTAVLTYFLTKDDFGQYRYVLSVVPILAIFSLQGIGTAMIRSVAKGRMVDLGKILKTKIKWSLIGSVAAIFISAYYFYQTNSALGYSFLIVAILLPVYENFYVYSYYYKGRQEFKKDARFEVAVRLIQAIVLITTAALTKNFIAILGVYFLARFLSSGVLYLYTSKVACKNSSIESREPDDTIKYGTALSFVGILGTLTANMDKLFVWHLLGDAELALYYVALVIPYNVVLLINVIPRIAFPKFSQKDWLRADYDLLLKRIKHFFLALLIPAGICYALLPYFLPLFFPGYGGSIIPALLLSLIILISPINTIIAQMLRAIKAVKNIVMLRTVFILGFAATFLLLYSKINILAAASAYVTAELISLVLGIYLLIQLSRKSAN